MSDRKSPAEKKIESYVRDRRNVYRANDKASRKGIPRHKAWVNRTYRRSVKQELSRFADDTESSIDVASKASRPLWKKDPDGPLGLALEIQPSEWDPVGKRWIYTELDSSLRDSPLRKEAKKRLRRRRSGVIK